MAISASATRQLSTVVYVSCDDRSGSTLVERCLAALPTVCSIGELHNLPAYANDDRSFFDPPYEFLCSCGKHVTRCGFWTAVAARLGVRLEDLKLRVDFPRRHGLPDLVDRARWRLEDRGRGRSGAFQHSLLWQWLLGYPDIARRYWQVYEAVAAVSGKPVVVDSSKWALRFNYLGRADRQRLRVLLMYRSPWAVVHSKYRHEGLDAASAARKWLAHTRQMENFAAHLPQGNVVRLFYEDFCRAPEAEFRRIQTGLGIGGEVDVLAPASVADMHHIGGSPSQFDSRAAGIVLDERYLDEMDAAARAVVDGIAGPAWSRLRADHGREGDGTGMVAAAS